MTVVVLGEQPEMTELIERRRRLGQDRFDEVWEGAYHVAPDPRLEHSFVQAEVVTSLSAAAHARGLRLSLTFNLGDGPDDFRIPDFGFHDGAPRGVWISTAVIVGEVLSPGDETWQKLPFYASCGVEEVWIVDADERTVRVFVRRDESSYDEVDASPRMGLSTVELADIDWP